jgi:hypothetical protein
MEHWVVIEYEALGSYYTMKGPEMLPTKMWNILYQVPIDIGDDGLEKPECMLGCRVWLENNRVYGSKYAITKMWLV